MCGRFTLRDPAKACERFLRRRAGGLPEPRFNIAPGRKLPVIRAGEGDRRELEEMLWGFLPPWSRGEGKVSPIVNARAETVHRKPAFREAFHRRRCIVPADGFYEWRKEGSQRHPHFFRLRHDLPFALAALWEEGQDPAGHRLRTFCLLTTEANPLLSRIHDRMPVMLDEAGASRWLNLAVEEPAAELAPLLQPFPDEEMESLAVSSWVNKADHEGPRCLSPQEDDPEQLPLW